MSILSFVEPQHRLDGGRDHAGDVIVQKTICRCDAAFLAAKAKLSSTYEVGATAQTPPDGYVVDRIKLGEGEAVFQLILDELGYVPASKAGAELLFDVIATAYERWEQFRLGWVDAWPSDTPIKKIGELLAVMGRAVGVWWLNVCRVVYVVDEARPLSKFGLAYGTLPASRVARSDSLSNGTRATTACGTTSLPSLTRTGSRPRLGYPVVRSLQKRFGQDYAASMLRAVSSGDEVKDQE